MHKYEVWVTVEADSALDALVKVVYSTNELGIDDLVSIDNVRRYEL